MGVHPAIFFSDIVQDRRFAGLILEVLPDIRHDMCDVVILVLGDGAEWIDQTAAWLFPRALGILDYYYASERIWATPDGAQQWAHSKLSQLKGRRIKQVLAVRRGLKVGSEEGQRVRNAAINYVRIRQGQIRYSEYQAEGLPIGSGAVESTCKQMVAVRCKQEGMRWSEAGADAILCHPGVAKFCAQ